jgi:glycosyltransferase involved in cell wall biosynthesis
MKIVFLMTNCTERSISGKAIIDLISARISCGDEVQLITSTENSTELRNISTSVGFDLVELSRLKKKISLIDDFLCYFAIRKFLKKNRPHVIVTVFAKTGVLGRLASNGISSAKVIHWLHGTTFPPTLHVIPKFFYIFIERLLSYYTNHFLFVGEELRQTYIDFRICTDANSSLLRIGVNDNFFNATIKSVVPALIQKWRRQNYIILVNIGRIVPSKNQSASLSAVKMLSDRGIKVAIIILGEALTKTERQYIGTLKRRVTELKIEDIVDFGGFVNDVIPYLHHSDLVISTSLYEGLSSVLVESALVGRPVATFDYYGAREVIQDFDNGFVVEQGDLQSLVDAIELILYLKVNQFESPEGMFGKVGRAEPYTLSTMNSNFKNIIDHLLQAPH